MSKLYYGVEITTDQGDVAHTPLAITNPALAMINGVIRIVSDRPGYDGHTVVPTYGPNEIDNFGTPLSGPNANVYYQDFFQKAGILANPSNEIDVSTSGGAATLSEFEFVVTNTRLASGCLVETESTGGAITSIVASGTGAGYTVGDKLTVLGGVGGVVQVSAATAGVPTAFTVTAPGTGYTDNAIYATLPINGTFWNAVETGNAGNPISLIGRKVRFVIFIDDVMYSRWVGVITNNPFTEVDYHISCGPDLTVHKTLPPNMITITTLPNIGIGNEQTSQVTISGAVSPQSNIPANATVASSVLPVCFGDIPYAQLFNINGVPTMEKIAILGRGITPPANHSNLFDISCAVNPLDAEAVDPSVMTGPVDASVLSYIDDKGNSAGIAFADWTYNLVMVLEDLGNLKSSYAGYGNTPCPMADSLIAGGAFFRPAGYAGNVDKFKDFFVFKQGDQKGIRILHSTSSYAAYLVTGSSPAAYRYLFVTVLLLAECPDNVTSENILIPPGRGYTPTDAVSQLAGTPIGGNTQASFVQGDGTTFWQVCKNLITQVVSNFKIIKFTPALLNGNVPAHTNNAQALPVLMSFSSNLKIYENVNNIIQSAVVNPVADPLSQFPYLQIKASADVQQNGVSLLNPLLLPAKAIQKIEFTFLGNNSNDTSDPVPSHDAFMNPMSRSILYGTPVGGAPPFVADSTKPSGQSVFNASDFNNLVDRDRTTHFPSIVLSYDNYRSLGGGEGAGHRLPLKYATDSYGRIYHIFIDNTTYSSPTGYKPYDLLEVTPDSGSGKAAIVQVLSVDSSGTPLTIGYIDETGTAIQNTPLVSGSGYTNNATGAGYIHDRFDTNGAEDIASPRGYMVTFSIDMTSIIDTEIDKAFFGIDFVAQSTNSPEVGLSYGLNFRLLDQQNRPISLGDNVNNGALACGAQGFIDPIGNFIVTKSAYGNTHQNFLPKDYYAGGGNSNGESDRFFLASYPQEGSGNAFAEIDFKTILSLIKSRVAQPVLLVDFVIIGNTAKSVGSGALVDITGIDSSSVPPGAILGAQVNPYNRGIGYSHGDQILVSGGYKGVMTVDVVDGSGRIGNLTGPGGGYGYTVSTKNSSTPYSSSNIRSADTDITLQINQIGFVSQKTISTANKDLFAEIQGETVGNDGATATNTIHTAIQHIMEDYDKIPVPLIDYGNLATTRGLSATTPWYVGRQVQEQQNSIDYIIELCRHGFLAYFLSRTGKHSFTAWQDNTSPIATHDASIVARNSIGGLIKTDISCVYNDFNLQYNINPGLSKLDHSIIITHVDDREPGVTVSGHAPGDGFPAIGCLDGDGVPLWIKYTSWTGIPNYKGQAAAEPSQPALNAVGDTYYATATAGSWISGNYYTWTTAKTWNSTAYQAAWTAAQTLWNICHDSWLKSFTIQQVPHDLSQLNWFNDRTLLSDPALNTVGINTGSSAWLLLNKLIIYITKQKDTVPYSVPINADTAQLDMMMPIDLNDILFTSGVARLGWIEKIETDALNGKLNLQLILQ